MGLSSAKQRWRLLLFEQVPVVRSKISVKLVIFFGELYLKVGQFIMYIPEPEVMLIHLFFLFEAYSKR